MRTLLLAGHANGRLDPLLANSITAAVQLGGEVDVLVAGAVVSSLALAVAKFGGIARVLAADSLGLAHQAAAPLAELIVSLAGSYEAIVAPTSSTGRDVMPRVAALLDVRQISDVTEILTADTYRHPIYAGTVIETVRCRDLKRVLTVRAAAFAPAQPSGGNAVIVKTPVAVGRSLGRVVAETVSKSARPELGSARIVVAGGRGLGSRDNFERLLMPLATRLQAGLGATRNAIEADFAARELHIGHTGHVVAPELYIAVGLSGSVQHLAGMEGSKVIVAINNDPHAPIFSVADYGLVGDLFQLVPSLMLAL